MGESIHFSATRRIGYNDLYTFHIGLVEDRWLGFALSRETPRSLFFFPEVSDDLQMGMKDQNKAVLLTGALAQDVESGYGGITTWEVPEELRGDPEKYRCATCGAVGCNGRDCVDALEDYEADMP